MNILIDTHFKIRWNERINEKSTYKDITKFIKECIYNNKFELYWKNNYFLVDNDIIIKAKVKTKNEKIVFIRV